MSKPAPKLVFMSPAHVAEMNRILASDPAVRTASLKLPRPYTLAYQLAHGQETVWWTMDFDPTSGVRFGLDAPARTPELTFHGDYEAVVRATFDQKAGKQVPLPVTQTGDPKMLEVVGEAFAAARASATLDTDLPSF